MSDIPPSKTEFHSPFGGLWTDLLHAEKLLDGKLALGWLQEDEVEDLRFWIENGYVILRNAVPSTLLDRVQADINQVIEKSLPEATVAFWKDGQKLFQRPNRNNMTELEAKLLDMHMISEAVRAAVFAPRLLRFLNLVFERPPNAFQSLTFEYGSQQPVHCDVAFVRVSSPREFVASWVALEDIESGSGELEYYAGSQKLPDLLFEDSSPWASGDLTDYSDRLCRSAEGDNLEKQRFLPRRGDVLIWSAGLYHGGSARTRPEVSRRSLVTHYCPADRYPMYANESFSHVHPTSYGGSVSGCFPDQPLSI